MQVLVLTKNRLKHSDIMKVRLVSFTLQNAWGIHVSVESLS